MIIVYDLDGVICEDIKEQPGTQEYQLALETAALIQKPDRSTDIIVTGRTENHRKTTEKWLKRYGITNKLIMKPIELSGVENTPAYKSARYIQENGIIFIESDSFQAEQIAQLSGKPVFCIENNKIYR
jgi:orotate phosphoribosyltransferase